MVTSRSRFFGPLGAEAARNKIPGPEPLGKKSGIGAARQKKLVARAAKKLAGFPALHKGNGK